MVLQRDLKPQNLLLSDPSDRAILKIADFGFARDLQPQRMADTLCGSPLYMAPEILQYQKYDAKVMPSPVTSASYPAKLDFLFDKACLEIVQYADKLVHSPHCGFLRVLRKQRAALQADLWSVGIILYELLLGRTPFDGVNHIQLLRNIERQDVHIPLTERSKLSPHSIHLIYNLLKRNPIERMSFEVTVYAKVKLSLPPFTYT